VRFASKLGVQIRHKDRRRQSPPGELPEGPANSPEPGGPAQGDIERSGAGAES
jgi:hypothetical protein